MSATIVPFPGPLPPDLPQESGNGAREPIQRYFDLQHTARTMAKSLVTPEEIAAALSDADHFLMWLWVEGFKVVPLDMTDHY